MPNAKAAPWLAASGSQRAAITVMIAAMDWTLEVVVLPVSDISSNDSIVSVPNPVSVCFPFAIVSNTLSAAVPV